MLRALAKLLVPLTILLLACPAQAQEPLAKEPETVIYAFDQQFPPFSFVQNGEPKGFDIDLMEAALSREDIKLQMRPMTWDQALINLSGGGAQLATGMAKTEQRMLLYNFSDTPTSTLRMFLYTKRANRVPTVEQLRGDSVAVEKGSLHQRVLEAYGGLIVRQYPDDTEAIKALYRDQTTAYAGDDKTTQYLLDKLNLQGISPVGTPMQSTDVYIAVYKDRPDLLRAVNQGLLRIRQNGEYDRIYRKWFVTELTASQQKQLVDAAREAAVNSYAPYTQKPVGAAVLTQAGDVYTGCAVENALESLTASAVKVAVFNAVNQGAKDIKAAVAVDAQGHVRAPTAEERQLLLEFGRGVLALTEPEPGTYEVYMVSQLLPYGFEDRAMRRQTE